MYPVEAVAANRGALSPAAATTAARRPLTAGHRRLQGRSMRHAGKGLTEIHTDDLKRLLAAIHREQLRFPVDIGELTRVGLQHCATLLLAMLRGLDAPAVRAVVVCVLAERLHPSTSTQD